uniref:Uncharacterized protein n=1 Tax=Phage sp. ctR9T2 TaxID=2825795 RepID=A0A8S5UFW5_9VIRU|nr:MAG TPA: hypothetical protein [Phage sp. ctR9T2]
MHLLSPLGTPGVPKPRGGQLSTWAAAQDRPAPLGDWRRGAA